MGSCSETSLLIDCLDSRVYRYIYIYSVNRYSYSVLYLWPIADHFKHVFVLQRETDLTINNKGKHVNVFHQQKGGLDCWKIPDQHGGF